MAHDPRLLFKAKTCQYPPFAGVTRSCHCVQSPRHARNHAPLAICAEAFEAITSTLPLGSVGYENETRLKG